MPYEPEVREERLARLSSWVAEADGRIVGYAALVQDDDQRWRLGSLYVLPSHFGLAVGANLTHAAATHVRTRRETLLRVACFAQNERARRAYMAWGATIVGESEYPIDGVNYPTTELVWEDLDSLVDRTLPTPIRPVDLERDITVITDLVHRAYAPLAEMNLHFVATHQSEQVTRERFERGTGFVMERAGEVVGTVTVSVREAGFYGDVRLDGRWASFGQLAIDPALRGLRLGERLVRYAERHAQLAGCGVIALDTAEPARHLQSYYARLGYKIVGSADWRPEVNYRSVIMAKSLTGMPLRCT
jgi:predicted N-acetyltransferase YhbS